MQTAANNPAILSAKLNPAIETGRAFNAFSEALLRFNEDAVAYCQSIHESAANDYAADYRRMLQNCAKGLEWEEPGIPVDLFEPNRKLIQSMLERIYEKYFPARIRTSDPIQAAKCG